MKEKIDLMTEKLRDERSKKVAFVSHCLLNENTPYWGGAFRPGCIKEYLDLGFEVVGVVGISGSPFCSVHTKLDFNQSFEYAASTSRPWTGGRSTARWENGGLMGRHGMSPP